MKKLLSFILTLFVTVNIVLAGGGGGASLFPITTMMNGQQPAEYKCAGGYFAGGLTGQTGIVGTNNLTACPGGGCINPGFFAPYYETYRFKNTLLTPQCINVNLAAAAAQGYPSAAAQSYPSAG